MVLTCVVSESVHVHCICGHYNACRTKLTREIGCDIDYHNNIISYDSPTTDCIETRQKNEAEMEQLY